MNIQDLSNQVQLVADSSEQVAIDIGAMPFNAIA
jgi:hypothetical protein